MVTDDDGYCSRRGSRCHVPAFRAKEGAWLSALVRRLSRADRIRPRFAKAGHPARLAIKSAAPSILTASAPLLLSAGSRAGIAELVAGSREKQPAETALLLHRSGRIASPAPCFPPRKRVSRS